MMCETPYIYTPEIAQKDFERKANNCNRVWFAILLDDIVIGDVYLKNIDLQKGSGTLSIVLIQDCYKEKGYGTAVERTVLEYGFKELGLSVIYADVVLRNTRSQHVLEKIGDYEEKSVNKIFYDNDRRKIGMKSAFRLCFIYNSYKIACQERAGNPPVFLTFFIIPVSVPHT